MRQAFFTKNREEKSNAINEFVDLTSCSNVIYIYPKNRKNEITTIDGNCYNVSYEDLTKTNNWLHINNLVSKECCLVFENPSRYPKITSQKVKHLRRLSMQVDHCMIVDIVPFTMNIKYLYTPYSYLGRDILGYAHYYAFRENYLEKDEDGNIKAAHDHCVLAPKMATVSTITHQKFLCPNRNTINISESDEELLSYAKLRDDLFGKEKSPRRIITKLADHVHAYQTRRDKIVELVKSLKGKTIVYTNLNSYSNKIRVILKKNKLDDVIVTSYQLGSYDIFDNCIYAESPITNSYFLLDAESRLPSTCNVYHLLGKTKVDNYLFDLISKEINSIDGLSMELYKCTI